MMSLPMRGEWIEISHHMPYLRYHGGLSPCGESGLKFRAERGEPTGRGRSLPMRGEWIEMLVVERLPECRKGLSPCGESGLKFRDAQKLSGQKYGLSPCGESGLKCSDGSDVVCPL